MPDESDKSGALAKWAKRFGIAIGVLVVVVAVTYGIIYALTESRLNKTYDVTVATLEVEPHPKMIERGKEIATFRGCRDCHGADLAGRVVGENMPVMTLAGPNITPAGVTANYTHEDWARVVRHGVRPNGTPVRFMPSYEWTELSHEDMAALIAYAESVKPVEKPGPSFEVGPMGRVLYIAGQLPLNPAEMVNHDAKPANPTPGPTAEYGRYLASACVGCHGPNLSGGKIPGTPPDWPPAANLTSHASGMAEWKYEDFRTAMREGVRPDGRKIREEYMPWPLIRESSDDDLLAIYKHLREVEQRPYGGR